MIYETIPTASGELGPGADPQAGTPADRLYRVFWTDLATARISGGALTLAPTAVAAALGVEEYGGQREDIRRWLTEGPVRCGQVFLGDRFLIVCVR